jgi:hypothetical protein
MSPAFVESRCVAVSTVSRPQAETSENCLSKLQALEWFSRGGCYLHFGMPEYLRGHKGLSVK